MQYCSYENYGINSFKNFPLSHWQWISQYGICVNVNSRNQILLELTMLPLGIVRRVSINLLLLWKLDTGSPLATSNGVSLRPLCRKSNKDLSLKQARDSRWIAELPKHWGLCFYTAQNCVMAPEALKWGNNSTEHQIASWKSQLLTEAEVQLPFPSLLQESIQSIIMDLLGGRILLFTR